MLAFDKWTDNVDSRQTIFRRKGRQKEYAATFIDRGTASISVLLIGLFWTILSRKLSEECGLHGRRPESLEPWLSRIEKMGATSMCTLTSRIPPQCSSWMNHHHFAENARSFRTRGHRVADPSMQTDEAGRLEHLEPEGTVPGLGERRLSRN